jgi:HPt (histidine-containing phosphotransfer) domain-containing protein
MDLRHFLKLYTAEAQEHVRLLQRTLLQLESGAGGAAIEDAFRAAHTLKGMPAAMGSADIADLAHSLEDRLADVRGAGTAPSLIDELLAAADAIRATVDCAVAGGAADAAPAVSAAPASAQPAATPAPAGTVTIAGVRLCSDSAGPAVRALLVLRALDGTASVLGTDPAAFDDECNGRFRIFLGAGAADAAVRHPLRRRRRGRNPPRRCANCARSHPSSLGARAKQCVDHDQR